MAVAPRSSGISRCPARKEVPALPARDGYVLLRGALGREKVMAACHDVSRGFVQQQFWYGQDNVRVNALVGTLAQAAVPISRERARLGAPAQTGKDTLDWSLDFATPLAALSLTTTRANTLVPVRILGRMDAAQP